MVTRALGTPRFYSSIDFFYFNLNSHQGNRYNLLKAALSNMKIKNKKKIKNFQIEKLFIYCKKHTCYQ